MSAYITPKSQIENVRKIKIASLVDYHLSEIQKLIGDFFIDNNEESFRYDLSFNQYPFLTKDVLSGVTKELTKGGYEVEFWTNVRKFAVDKIDDYLIYNENEKPVIRVSR